MIIKLETTDILSYIQYIPVKSYFRQHWPCQCSYSLLIYSIIMMAFISLICFCFLFSRIFGVTKEHGLVLDTDDLTSIIRDPTSLCTVPPISEKHLLKKISLYALSIFLSTIQKSELKAAVLNTETVIYYILRNF